MNSLKQRQAPFMTVRRRLWLLCLCLTALLTAGCNANVGVGMSVGIPVGDHGYISVGGNSWF